MDTNNSKKRPSEAELLKRRQIGLQIIKDHKYELSENAFKKEYIQRVQAEMSSSISSGKLTRDIVWIVGETRKEHPSFDFTTKPLKKHHEKESITPLAFFEKDITEIHLVFADRTSTIIFDTDRMQLGTDSFVEFAIKQLPENFPDNSPVVLRIYFSPMSYRGIETVVCDIYERTPEVAPFDVISTYSKHRCAEIEVKKSNLLPLLEFTYKLFNRYWKTRINKANSAKNRKQKKNSEKND